MKIKNDLEERLGEHDVQLMEIYTVMEQFLEDKAEHKKWEDRKRLGYKQIIDYSPDSYLEQKTENRQQKTEK